MNIVWLYQFVAGIIFESMGEELTFRIFPSLIIPEFVWTRLFISIIVFVMAHARHWISGLNLKELFSLMLGGIMFSLIEYLPVTTIQWYVLCCIVHSMINLCYYYRLLTSTTQETK